MIPRREFTRGCALATAGLAVALPSVSLAAPVSNTAAAPSTTLRRAAAARGPVMLESLTKSSFDPLQGSTFQARGASGAFRLRLAEVEGYRPSRPEAQPVDEENRFSLHFTGPADAVHPQGIYRLQHDVLGTVELFLVPVGRSDNGVRYEAVFNRIG